MAFPPLALLVIAGAIAGATPVEDPLAYFVGRWQGVVRLYAAGPDQAPLESVGELVNRWLPGGRILAHEFRGPSRQPGQDFVGLGYLAYDPEARSYQGIWMDSLTPVARVGHGSFDPTSRSFSLRTLEGDPRMGREFRVLLRLVDQDRYEYRRFKVGPGSRLERVLEIDYTRVR